LFGVECSKLRVQANPKDFNSLDDGGEAYITTMCALVRSVVCEIFKRSVYTP